MAADPPAIAAQGNVLSDMNAAATVVICANTSATIVSVTTARDWSRELRPPLRRVRMSSKIGATRAEGKVAALYGGFGRPSS
jgi:hypothetical protein